MASRSPGRCSISGRSSATKGTRYAPNARCGQGASMPGHSSPNLLPAKVFFEADEALVPDDDVVDQLDVQDAPRRQELLRRLDIIRRRSWITAGMVMAEDQAGAFTDDGRAEDLGGA